MRDTTLMQQALGLTPPWTVVRSDFDTAAGRLDVEIDFTPGSRFACPTCGAADCPAYDTQRKTWRHLNFFQHQAYLNARVPRVRCETCGIRQVNVPWPRPDSGFPLLFEAMVMTMVDLDQARVLFATEGKDAATVAAFAADLAAHGGNPAAIEEVCIAMSPAFIKGVADSLPAAAVTFDKFHAVKIINDAVDQVRRAEQKQQAV